MSRPNQLVRGRTGAAPWDAAPFAEYAGRLETPAAGLCRGYPLKNRKRRAGSGCARRGQRNTSAMMAAIKPNVASQLTVPINSSVMRPESPAVSVMPPDTRQGAERASVKKEHRRRRTGGSRLAINLSAASTREPALQSCLGSSCCRARPVVHLQSSPASPHQRDAGVPSQFARSCRWTACSEILSGGAPAV